MVLGSVKKSIWINLIFLIILDRFFKNFKSKCSPWRGFWCIWYCWRVVKVRQYRIHYHDVISIQTCVLCSNQTLGEVPRKCSCEKVFWKYAVNLRRKPIRKCDFNKVAAALLKSNFSMGVRCIFSEQLFYKATSDGLLLKHILYNC